MAPVPAARPTVRPESVRVVPAPEGAVVVVQQQQQQRRGSRAVELVLFIGALMLTLLQVVLFLSAYGSLNSSNPDAGGARASASGILFLGIVAAAMVIWVSYNRRAHPVPAAVGGFFGLFVGGALASGLEDTFGFLGDIGWVFTEMVLLAIMLIPFIVFLVMIHGRNERIGWGLGMGLLFFHLLAYLSLASYILTHTDQLAEAARQANQSPAWGILGVAVALGTVALVRRGRDA